MAPSLARRTFLLNLRPQLLIIEEVAGRGTMKRNLRKEWQQPGKSVMGSLLESRISNFYTNFQVDEIDRVVSVGDGIAHVYGLNKIQAGEMVEFSSGVKRIALNLENENVGIVVVILLLKKEILGMWEACVVW
ncbi:Alpha subunit of the F1 sector of mitochondrial F1F0 ATP synthase [Datura stramonium]|uniref:Alpha subunit of the F1 sector of mitochondrial F1F0 ATP synthase n=1 Tax=Datura stramonium TaxID=4076 RepID=A0ABS8WVF5_DATST|nr:Alpha subunit of the F1 sector of mitochondrial F1F0 ATP synthase [Datura stramonium]